MTPGIPSVEPAPAAPVSFRHRFGRRLVVAAVVAVVAGGAVVAAMARSGGPANDHAMCVDVAHDAGLDFVGDPGPVFPAQNAYGTLMQQNMGNGAAVGDIDGDGYLDVLLLGQAGHASRLFHNDPAPGGGRRFSDVTEAAGLGGVTSNARVAQFVDLAGSGRPDLVIAADYEPGGPGGRRRSSATTAPATSPTSPPARASIRPGTSSVAWRWPTTTTPVTRASGSATGPTRAHRTRDGRRSRASSRARTVSTATSATTASRTSRHRWAHRATTATASRRSSRTSPTTGCPTSTRPTTTARTGSTRTWVAGRSAIRATGAG